MLQSPLLLLAQGALCFAALSPPCFASSGLHICSVAAACSLTRTAVPATPCRVLSSFALPASLPSCLPFEIPCLQFLVNPSGAFTQTRLFWSGGVKNFADRRTITPGGRQYSQCRLITREENPSFVVSGEPVRRIYANPPFWSGGVPNFADRRTLAPGGRQYSQCRPDHSGGKPFTRGFW